MTVPARASDYPSRQVTVIVPFAAGGPTDTVARIVTAQMSKSLGQNVAVDNRAGAGGTLATSLASRAAADGYTLIAGHMGTHAAVVSLYPTLNYHPKRDFEPVSLLAGTPIVILARKDFPPKNLEEFAVYIRANTERLNVAHAGIGSVSYVSCLVLHRQLGARPTGVPFSGTGPAMAALVAGEVDYMCDQIVNAVPHIKSGAIKAYAIAMPERSPSLPDVPTTAEAGMPSFQARAWVAMFAPKGTPPSLIAVLNAAASRALDDDNVRSTLQALGAVIPPPEQRTPGALADLVDAEIDRLSPVLWQAANSTAHIDSPWK
ncbi:tripartite-type tricarboxylate transporter receptor subunit TctC [Rhodopseudomonas faecalis]|uniref:Tripartite-type tricarboxylate transporter receptor subunit TctC n=2 Tax=Rhodopseudomonas faecalis TaxID=99655 RepID=A0A318TC00_9BRAD|nr:tripartite-type tricarboxylate transporter receptor subunit TctC [Rhodopseudomonas faecalis]